MGEAGRERMGNAFSADIFYRRIMQVYDEAIGSQQPA
jgi:hypothetical protein